MNNLDRQISLSDAMKIAENAARRNFSCLLPKEDANVLADDYAEAENYWMFFRSKEIMIPPDGELRGGWVYVVSKTGELREVPDFSSDKQKLNKYLEKMSKYFISNRK
jgi:hypothetical protein